MLRVGSDLGGQPPAKRLKAEEQESGWVQYLPEDLFGKILGEYSGLNELRECASVCAVWKRFAEGRYLWQQMFVQYGIPMVQSAPGQQRNYREDFSVLFPITISGSDIGRFFGRVVGGIPSIPENFFNALQEEDPFEKGKLKKDTCEFVVDPAFVELDLSREMFWWDGESSRGKLVLDGDGCLHRVELDGDVPDGPTVYTTIPFSLSNILAMGNGPVLEGKGGPLFFWDQSVGFFGMMCSEFEQMWDSCPIDTNIYFHRKKAISEVDSFPAKGFVASLRSLAAENGFEVVPMRVRVLSNVVHAQKFGKALDGEFHYTFTAESESTPPENEPYPGMVGNFQSKEDFVLCINNMDDHGLCGEFGVAMGLPADAS